MLDAKRNTKSLALSLFSGILLLGAPATLAKAYYPTAREMIQQAEFIALVRLQPPVAQETQGGNWTYRETSNAQLSKTIKGTLPANFKIHGKETFRCAQCQFLDGENLVFLRKDHDLYVGQAWDISCLPVKDGKASWFSNLDSRRPDVQAKLDDCIKQIKGELKH
jgi:hypothetical protein